MSPVVFILIDGLRPDAISETGSPNLFQLCQQGSYTLQARSVMPCLTLPCHLSIFHSVPPERHGITSNTWSPMARPLPGLLEKAYHADLRCGFFYNWEPLRNISQPGNLVFSFCHNSSETEFQQSDAIIAEAAATYIPKYELDFSFVYLGTLDTYGHLCGWMSEEYLAQLTKVDQLVGNLLATFSKETRILLQSDHGGHDRSHGEDLPSDMTIPWIIQGPGIRQGYQIQSPVSLLDTTPTLAHCLGIKPHPQWEGHCIDEVFES